MGLTNDVIYVNIIEGKFAQRTNAEDPQAKERTNKAGEVVYERLYRNLTGKLIKLYTQVNKDFGKSWLFILDDGKDIYQLRVPFTGRLPEGFLLRIPNIVINLPVKFSIFTDPEGKVVTYLRQLDKTVPKYWNAENNYMDLPQLQDVVHENGVPGKDGTRRMEYVQEYLENMDSLKPISHATQ